jgi:DNA repair exonuclease SbcCD ATPase subunit
MKKQLPALLAAIFMTGIIALVMVVTSANALFNKDVVDNANTSSAVTPNPAAAVSSSSALDQAKIQQLQARIDEYAAREKQYQQREQQFQQTIQSNQDQVQQAARAIQQVKQLLTALQDRGLIRVQDDGSIVLTGRN